MRLELSSGPLNEAIAKLEKVAALYERIGAAQGGVAAGGGGGVVRGGGGGGRVVSGRATVGGRGGGVIEGLMRGNPGLSREAATVMAGNLPAGAGGAGAGGGRGGGGIGGGPGSRGMPLFRERMRLPGTGLVGGSGGPWALAAAGVYGFVSALRGAVQAVDELHKAALVTGGSMQEVARLQALGVNATEANALRARMATDPFTIMSMGYMPDPRFGGPQNNAALVQTAIQRLRRLRGRPDAQLMEARRMGVGEDVIAAANLGEGAYQMSRRAAAMAPTPKEAQDIADLQSKGASLALGAKYAAGRMAATFLQSPWKWLAFAAGGPAGLASGLGLGAAGAFGGAAGQKGPGSPESKADDLTRALNDLSATIKTTNRSLTGRGMQDRGAFPSALFGTELMRGIRGGAIRMGAFR